MSEGLVCMSQEGLVCMIQEGMVCMSEGLAFMSLAQAR